MKTIFVLFMILCSILPAQRKYVLKDYHHDDFYAGNGNWVRDINKAMKLDFIAANDSLLEICHTPKGDPNDEYSGSAPIRIQAVQYRVSKSSKSTYIILYQFGNK